VVVALAARRTKILDGRHVRAQVEPRFVLIEVSPFTLKPLAPFAELPCAVVELVVLSGEPLDRRCNRRADRA
jgi:hypothetical protein